MNTMQIHTESLKTVSVVIPCFNEEKTIRKCIETTIRCSRNDLLLEILVVDGGSDDDTLRNTVRTAKKIHVHQSAS